MICMKWQRKIEDFPLPFHTNHVKQDLSLFTRLILFEIFDDFLCGCYTGLAGEDLLCQDAMHFLVTIGAAVFDDHQIVVHIGSPAHGCEDDPARRDATQNERGDPLCTQDRLKWSGTEGADAMFSEHDFPRARSDLLMH